MSEEIYFAVSIFVVFGSLFVLVLIACCFNRRLREEIIADIKRSFRKE